jgi:hypothetical protein
MSQDNETYVGDLKTGGTTWTVTVGGHHWFTGRADGFPDVTGRSWDEVESSAKVRASQAKIRVAVPYAYIGWDGPRDGKYQVIKHGTATGIHSNGHKILVREDGKPAQLDIFDNNSRFMPPSEDDGLRMIDLSATIKSLGEELRTLTGKYKFPAGNLGGQVRHEIDEARKAEGQ